QDCTDQGSAFNRNKFVAKAVRTPSVEIGRGFPVQPLGDRNAGLLSALDLFLHRGLVAGVEPGELLSALGVGMQRQVACRIDPVEVQRPEAALTLLCRIPVDVVPNLGVGRHADKSGGVKSWEGLE